MAAHQAPLFLGFSRQEHWSGLPFPSPISAVFISHCELSLCSGLISTCDSVFTFIICPHVTTNTVFHKQIISQRGSLSFRRSSPLPHACDTLHSTFLAQRKLSMLLFWHLICISFIEVKWKLLSHVWLFATPWTTQSMEFSRPEYWSG